MIFPCRQHGRIVNLYGRSIEQAGFVDFGFRNTTCALGTHLTPEQFGDEKTRRTLQRLDRRLLDIDSRLDRLATAGK